MNLSTKFLALALALLAVSSVSAADKKKKKAAAPKAPAAAPKAAEPAAAPAAAKPTAPAAAKPAAAASTAKAPEPFKPEITHPASNETAAPAPAAAPEDEELAKSMTVLTQSLALRPEQQDQAKRIIQESLATRRLLDARMKALQSQTQDKLFDILDETQKAKMSSMTNRAASAPAASSPSPK